MPAPHCWERFARFPSGEERVETDVFAGYVDRVFWGVCCERIISVHINWCRFCILLLIIYSGFHSEPWAVIFSDNGWQRQQNILKKLTKQPACTTTSFNSNSKSDSSCSWKVAFFRFQDIFSFLQGDIHVTFALILGHLFQLLFPWWGFVCIYWPHSGGRASEAHFTIKEFEFITYPFYPQYLVRAFRNGFIRKPPGKTPIRSETKPTLE